MRRWCWKGPAVRRRLTCATAIIVNMGMAEMAQCPVIPVADIDRGGCLPRFTARWRCCSLQERARVKGVIINKFRGDVALLRSGIEQIEALTGAPVLGVMPWLDVDLEG
ncbi:AAA family ATPase [Klebsiella pneumoniae subsp. pneumoniae]|nr:AAA family ATPase [Klebsiella pneumoniae subsp. pneumoniae]